MHYSGIAITATISFLLIVAGFAVALATPLMAGGHLIGAPLLVTAGGGLLTRLAYVQSASEANSAHGDINNDNLS